MVKLGLRFALRDIRFPWVPPITLVGEQWLMRRVSRVETVECAAERVASDTLSATRKRCGKDGDRWCTEVV
jgi:hypothetical protein